MDRGWVKLYRGITEWEWFADGDTLKLFIYLLVEANHKPRRRFGVEVKRGQILTGLTELSKNTSLSIQSLRTRLNRLKSTGEITSESTNKYSLITIVKYDVYQTAEENQQANQQANQQTNNKQLTTIKERKKDKNNTSSPQFDRFWSVYPKKVGKGAARKAWERIKPDEELVVLMIRQVEQSKLRKEWLKDGGQYIPHPATWLNQQRWEDEVGDFPVKQLKDMSDVPSIWE